MKYLSLAGLVLAACVQSGHADEAALAPGFTGIEWVLTTVDGKPAAYSATLDLGQPGRVTGQAPCNHYFADLTQADDSFRMRAIGATKMACPQMAEEAAYFQVLQGIEFAQAGQGTLTLTGGGHELVFAPPIE